MENCCESLVKYILVLFNLVLAITGLTLIGIGAYVKSEANNYLDFLGESYVNTPIILIIVGVVIFVIAFFGCYGACKESSWMMYTYAGFLVLILIAEIGAGIAAFVLKGALKDEVDSAMKEAMTNYNKKGFGGVTKTLDLIQRDLNCCGVDGPNDWHRTISGKIPAACCVGGIAEEGCETYNAGCLEVFADDFLANIIIVGGVAIGIAFVQLVGVFFAYCIGNAFVRRKEEYVRVAY